MKLYMLLAILSATFEILGVGAGTVFFVVGYILLWLSWVHKDEA